MMFLIHSAFALGLLALTAGAALYIWALRNQGAGTSLGRIVGFIVIVISTLSLICSFYLGTMIWKEIYYLNMAQLQHTQAQDSSMKAAGSSTAATKEHSQKK